MTLTRVNSNGITEIDKTKISGTAITAADTGTVTSAMIADGQVTSAKIADATIVNQDVSLTAAIEGTKISPNFGSQATATTGTSTAASFIPTGSSVPANGVYLPGANALGLATASTERVRITSTGLVGIGTTTVNSLFEVRGSSDSQNIVHISNSAGSTTGDTTNVIRCTSNGNTNWANLRYDAYQQIWNVGGTEAFRVDASRRLLVGTSSSSSGKVVVRAASAGETLGAFESLGGGNYGGNGVYKTARFMHSYWGGHQEVASIGFSATSSGAGSGYGFGDIVFYAGSSGNGDGGSTSTERIRITNSGELWTGSTTTQRYNNIQCSLWGYDPGAGAGAGVMVFVNLGTAGNGAYQGVGLSKSATSWGTYSDERGKTSLAPIENGLSKVSNLRAVTGRYLDDEENTRRSFLIAQDVQAVLPEAVDAADPDKLSLRYTEVIPLLVAALKESKERIETLEAAVTNLQQS